MNRFTSSCLSHAEHTSSLLSSSRFSKSGYRSRSCSSSMSRLRYDAQPPKARSATGCSQLAAARSAVAEPLFNTLPSDDWYLDKADAVKRLAKASYFAAGGEEG